MVRYWDGTAWTTYWAPLLRPRRGYWRRYRGRYWITAIAMGTLGAVVSVSNDLVSVSDAAPIGGSYSYALGHLVGGALVTVVLMFILAVVVNFAVAALPSKRT